MKSVLAQMLAPSALAVAFAAQIALFASLAGYGVPAALFPLALGSCVMLAASLSGLDQLGSLGSLGARDIALAALSGVLGLFLAPYLVASHRYSDAPPGTEMIFFACVLWGALTLLYAACALWREGRGRGALMAACGTLAGVTGAAGVLASWERPSSFSPLVRFAAEEGWMLVAGGCFVVGGLLIASLARRHGSTRPVLVSGVSATACGAAAFVVSGAAERVPGLSDKFPSLVLWAVVAGIAWLLWVKVLHVRREIAAGASLLLAPSLISLLVFAERLLGMAGPNPLIWPGIAGGTALTAAGALVLARVGSADDGAARPARWLRLLGMALFAAAAAGMFLPTLSVAVTAVRPGAALDVSWSLPGWETIPGWVALSCAGLMLAAAVGGSRLSAAAALLAPAAYLPLISTPYHVLTRWLPPEVQVDFGTEYASITFKALVVWPATVAVVGASLGLVVVLFGRAGGAASGAAVLPPEHEE